MGYRTFKRACVTWEEFVHNRKTTYDRGLTLEEARRQCKVFNDNRSKSQIKRGLMLEFESE